MVQNFYLFCTALAEKAIFASIKTLPYKNMKKLLLLFVAVASLVSCTEDITRNDPAFEGLKDGVRWRAGGSSAILGVNGDVTISGGNQFEVLTIHLPSATPGIYPLGTSDTRTVNFLISGNGVDRSYSTSTGRGDGQVQITEYNEITKTITGTFRFNAFDDEVDVPENGTDDILNFQSGFIFKVPVTGVVTQ